MRTPTPVCPIDYVVLELKKKETEAVTIMINDALDKSESEMEQTEIVTDNTSAMRIRHHSHKR